MPTSPIPHPSPAALTSVVQLIRQTLGDQITVSSRRRRSSRIEGRKATKMIAARSRQRLRPLVSLHRNLQLSGRSGERIFKRMRHTRKPERQAKHVSCPLKHDSAFYLILVMHGFLVLFSPPRLCIAHAVLASGNQTQITPLAIQCPGGPLQAQPSMLPEKPDLGFHSQGL